MDEILYDARWIGNHGIGRFAEEMQRQVPGLVPFQATRRPFHPLDPILLGSTLLRRNPGLFFSPGYNSPLGWPGRFIFTLHDLNHLRVPDNSSAMKRAYYKYIIRPACHRAEAVLTVSQYSQQEIAEWARIRADKIVNVSAGVGPAFTPAGDRYDPGYPYLLYVGSRKAHKNLPRLLQAFAASGVSQEIRLIFSGSPDSQTGREIERLGLQRSLAFADLPDSDRLSQAYRGAVGLVFPSLYEGFGLPPLEAMACGLPVLTSNVCSLPEVVGDAAILVNPLSVEEIADGIRRLTGSSDLRRQLREKGLLQAKKFSWEETGQRTAQVLNRVLERD
jgi:glycosyltransferase involved in cell wall biosynthesis